MHAWQGSIDMEEATRIEANQDWTGPQKAKHPHVLTIETLRGRVYYLSAPSKENMIAWVDKLSSTFKYFLLNNNQDSSTTSVSQAMHMPSCNDDVMQRSSTTIYCR